MNAGATVNGSELKSELLRLLNEAGTTGRTANDLAKALGVTKKEVNSALYGPLKNQVAQDKSYTWRSLVAAAEVRKDQKQKKAQSRTRLSDLSDYYLSCLSDDAVEVSAFSSSNTGVLDYTEIEKLPSDDFDPLANEQVSELIDRARRDKYPKTIYLGFPCFLRHVKSKKSSWEGCFVEPLFLYQVDYESNSGNATIDPGFPLINQSCIKSVSNSSSVELMQEVLQLETELGLSGEETAPELDDLLLRLKQIRSEWTWKEDIDPSDLGGGKHLSELTAPGIYNRAVIMVGGERPPYTVGLESELKSLGEKAEEDYEHTVLGKWITDAELEEPDLDSEPALEVLPMNSEQRFAVQRALSADLTVITGPPGTGKSQVVTNLLINAAWRGERVLFASKNNQAVDVVDARVNNIGTRPVLLRLGSDAYQDRLAQYLLAMLATRAEKSDEDAYDELKQIHDQLANQANEINKSIDRIVELRNQTDLLERKFDSRRDTFSQALTTSILNYNESERRKYSQKCEEAINLAKSATREGQSFFGGLFWKFNAKSKAAQGLRQLKSFDELLSALGIFLSTYEESENGIAEICADLADRRACLDDLLKYAEKYWELRSLPSLESLQADAQEIQSKLSKNSEDFWRAWINVQPSRMTSEDRRELSKYQAVLKMVIDTPADQRLDRSTYSAYQRLLSKVSHLLTVWAVTSLSAKGKIPLRPAEFDLVVFDEASQCDIASALPLLYRAKRAVIIGDPKQLSHITQLGKGRDQKLLGKYSLIEDFPHWAYSYNSLFDLAAGMAHGDALVNLRDHHRSHDDIISFSNEFFYEGKLRVATNYSKLRKPQEVENSARWVNVVGQTVRPANGGAANELEAKEVLSELRKLLIDQGYKGSIGVVSPFRAQANLIRRLASEDSELAPYLLATDFLVDTVHKFQGDERDVMIFSPVISTNAPRGAISFLQGNGNLFNVAITRARAMLIVVGDKAAASSSGVSYLEGFARHVQGLTTKRVKEEQARYTELSADYPAAIDDTKVSEWEKVLYRRLYSEGIRAIPQYSIDKYELDFAVFQGDRRLNIEVDGERYHRNWDGELCRRDQIRNQRMFELGWDVMRFWVFEIRDDMDNCIARIKHWIDAA